MNRVNDNVIAPSPRPFTLFTTLALLASAMWFTVCAEPNSESDPTTIPTACDLLAGHPSDPDKITEGVKTEQVMTHLPLAIEACRRDAALFPEQPRLTYYLGRSLFYSGEAKEGFAMVDAAANAGHEQAQFVGGLLAMAGAATGTADPCLARDYWERARAQGHFAATVSVATHQKLDTFAGCESAGPSVSEVQKSVESLLSHRYAGEYYNQLLLKLLQSP